MLKKRLLWLNGPIEYDGHKYWFKDGELHRTDGPAIEWGNGDKQWFQNGMLHREDGPAVEYANGKKEHWIKGIQKKEVE